jgi:hypothetical protein
MFVKTCVAAASGVVLVASTALPSFAAESKDAAESFLVSVTDQAAKGDSQAQATLAKYQALSDSETKEFSRGLALLAAKSENPANVPGVAIEETAGSVETQPSGFGVFAAQKSWSAYCSQKVSLLGFVVTETRVDGDFDTNGGKVTGIRNQRARVVKNYQPMTNVSFKDVRKEVTGGAGKVRALVRVERGPVKGGTSQSENWQTLGLNGSGKVTACRWGY